MSHEDTSANGHDWTRIKTGDGDSTTEPGPGTEPISRPRAAPPHESAEDAGLPTRLADGSVAGIALTPAEAGPPAERRAAWEAPFLAALARHGQVEGAAAAVGICRQTAYNRRNAHPEFAAAWQDALERHADGMEAELFRRGVEGVEEPVFYAGERIGTTRKYSDACLIFALKAARPSKYRERYDLRHAGPEGGAVRVQTEAEATAQLAPYSQAAMALYEGLLAKKMLESRPADLPGPEDPAAPKSA